MHLFNYLDEKAHPDPYECVALLANMDKLLYWELFGCSVERMVKFWNLGQKRSSEALACVFLANGGAPFPKVVDNMIKLHPEAPPSALLPLRYISVLRNDMGCSSIATPKGFFRKQIKQGTASVAAAWVYIVGVIDFVSHMANHNLIT